MSLFAIADLHLAMGSGCENKHMGIFKGWEKYTERLTENWNGAVGKDDTVVIAGDVSWADSLEGAFTDFEFINNTLHGRKIILKGNHDYWWTTLSKMNVFLASNEFYNISFLHNNAFLVDGAVVCGTRGYIKSPNETDDSHAEKLRKREALRLEESVKRAKECGGEYSEICAFLHYPPIYGGFENYEVIGILQGHGVKRCYYGHLHGQAARRYAVSGERYGIELSLVSADFVGFTPVKIENTRKNI